MSIPVTTLIGSPRRLVTTIVLFVALDLSVLVINLWLGEQLARDAVAINLAGRQRMLSQQTTKALLLSISATNPDDAALALQEFNTAFGLFTQTLTAFANGGKARGGDGAEASLQPVKGEAIHLVSAARDIVAPVERLLAAPESVGPMPGPQFVQAADYMVRNNQELLVLMNSLTTALERDSVRRARDLRAIQTGAFILALGNFLAIVVGLLRQFRAVESDNHQWRQLARHDPLTSLPNRKAFTEAAQGVLTRAEMDKSTGAVLMLDLDGFKPINDSFGHATGDRILIALAETLASTARATDVVTRLGGDEFAMLCPKLHGEDDIRHFCHRLLAAIELIPDRICPGSRLGASIGIAVYPDAGYNLDHLLGRADKAMYAAKQAGGSRWKVA